ncbi:MAG: DNA alkylation repair protein [Prolixibacteraceae bacterium]|nr:DNA alkylation repair protein [Prolixibacteraceae bacterium]
MDVLIDNKETEKLFKKIIASLPAMQNGDTAESMEKRGLKYEKNWGVSIVDLKNYASLIEKDHLLALKLWNKKWRETMILATFLDEPEKVTEEQMDYWVKTACTIELIEQMVFNLFPFTPFAFAKALEWCRGKKFNVKVAGLLLMGRLAATSKNDIDEMFESFFDVLSPLAKDKALYNYFFRSYCQLARRSRGLHSSCLSFAHQIATMNEVAAVELGNEILNEIGSDDFIQIIKK